MLTATSNKIDRIIDSLVFDRHLKPLYFIPFFQTWYLQYPYSILFKHKYSINTRDNEEKACGIFNISTASNIRPENWYLSSQAGYLYIYRYSLSLKMISSGQIIP
jgi:hypothetical protein